jgi:drug/metabolite transporter superfamily protein YnfA
MVVGLVILALGGAALLSPERVMGLLGYTFASRTSSAATLGEVRATYGGVFTVMGLLTALAAINPVANRGVFSSWGFCGWGPVRGECLAPRLTGAQGSLAGCRRRSNSR